MQKIAYAAVLLGVFSLSPLAKAEDAPLPLPPGAAPVAAAPVVAPAAVPQALAAPAPAVAPPASSDDDQDLSAVSDDHAGGMGLADLRRIAKDFSVKVQGTRLVMTGSIPRKCAIGAPPITVDSLPADADAGTPAQHEIRFVPGPDCSNLSKKDFNDRVWLNSGSLFGASRDIPNAEMDGPICLAHNDSGIDSCDAIPGAKYEANAKKAKAMQDAIAKQDAADKKAADEKQAAYDHHTTELANRINGFCKSGNFEGIGAQIELEKTFLGNVTAILAKVDDYKNKYYMDKISKAKDGDDAHDAYQSFMDAAADKGWDEDAATAAYAKKRVEIMQAALGDSEKSASDKASAIRDMASEFRDIGVMSDKVGDSGKTGKALVGYAYRALAENIGDDAGTNMSKLLEAEKYFREAEEYSDAEMKVEGDELIAKMYNSATKQCQAEAQEQIAKTGKPDALAKCDKFAAKDKAAEKKAAQDQAHIKGDDSLQALAGMKQQTIAHFGLDNYAMNISGYGIYNQAGGTYSQDKASIYTQGQQQFVMQQYMQRMMGGGATGFGLSGGVGSTGTSQFFQ